MITWRAGRTTSRISSPSSPQPRSWERSSSFIRAGTRWSTTASDRYKLGNAVGNLTERALVFATLVFGGVLDRCPELKPLPGTRRWLHLLRCGQDGQSGGGTGARFGRRAHPSIREGRRVRPCDAAKRIPRPVLLRLLHIQRACPPLPDRRSRHRPGRARHRLSGADGAARRGQLGRRPSGTDDWRRSRQSSVGNPARILGLS